MTALVTAKACAVQRGQAHLIDPVDISIGTGEFVLLIGANGAGKSTLARVLARLEQPTQGRVQRRRGVTVGYVPQHPQRDPTLPLSVANFLGLSAIAGPREEAILETLGIVPLADRPLAALSGGELRRTVIARALLRRSQLLLLDEPLAGIDLASQGPILELLSEQVTERQAGLLLVAHEILVALPFATRVALLDRALIADGAPADVVRSDEFVARFGPVIADAAMHVLSGSRVSHHG